MNLEFKIFQKLTQESTPSIGGQSIPSAIHLGSESISINEDMKSFQLSTVIYRWNFILKKPCAFRWNCVHQRKKLMAES